MLRDKKLFSLALEVNIGDHKTLGQGRRDKVGDDSLKINPYHSRLASCGDRKGHILPYTTKKTYQHSSD